MLLDLLERCRWPSTINGRSIIKKVALLKRITTGVRPIASPANQPKRVMEERKMRAEIFDDQPEDHPMTQVDTVADLSKPQRRLQLQNAEKCVARGNGDEEHRQEKNAQRIEGIGEEKRKVLTQAC